MLYAVTSADKKILTIADTYGEALQQAAATGGTISFPSGSEQVFDLVDGMLVRVFEDAA